MASVNIKDVAKRYGNNPPVITGANLEATGGGHL